MHTYRQDGHYKATVTITDNAVTPGTATQTVDIFISNANPTAVDDTTLTANEDTVQIITAVELVGNDSDPGPDDVLSIGRVDATSSKGASVVLNSNGTVSYDPTGSAILNALRVGASTVDSFEYVVSDGNGGEATATVQITVSGRNDQPQPSPDINAVTEDGDPNPISGNVLVSSDTDPDTNDLLRVASFGGQTNSATPVVGNFGTLTWDVNGDYSYTLDNGLEVVQRLADGQSLTEQFTYEVQDDSGAALDIASSVLVITIHGANDAPTPADDTHTTTADAVLVVEANSFDDEVLADGPIAYWQFGESAGSVAVNAQSPTTPDGTFVGVVGLSQPSLVPNSVDSALRLQDNSFVSIPDDALINTYTGDVSQKTFEFWFNADNVDTRQVLFAEGDSSNGFNVYLDAGELHFGAWDADVYGPTVNASVSKNVAYHVVAVFDQPNMGALSERS